LSKEREKEREGRKEGGKEEGGKEGGREGRERERERETQTCFLHDAINDNERERVISPNTSFFSLLRNTVLTELH